MPNLLPSSAMLLAFYRDGLPTADGYRWTEIVNEWPDARLESVHSYIQWLFPLREPSSANPSAPVLDAVVEKAFRDDAKLRARLRQSWVCMMRLYGWEVSEGRLQPSKEFQRRLRDWLTPGDHNHLRLTRIIRSLAALGLRDEAEQTKRALLKLVKERPEGVTKSTSDFWRDAQ